MLAQDGDSAAAHCRAVVSVEMLSLMGNRIWDFPECPSLNDVSILVTKCCHVHVQMSVFTAGV